MHDRLPEIVAEIPRVRKEVGYPPLVTPMSQIVGTQAVMNVLTGERWKIVSTEMREYLMGFYGKTPAPIDDAIREKVLGHVDVAKLQEEARNVHLQTYDEAKAEIGDLAETEEDVLSYALFPTRPGRFWRSAAPAPLRDITQPIDADASAPAATDTEGDTDMNVSQIRDLIEALDKSSVAEVTIKDGTTEVSIRKPVAATAAAGASAPAPEAPAPRPGTCRRPGARARARRPRRDRPSCHLEGRREPHGRHVLPGAPHPMPTPS